MSSILDVGGFIIPSMSSLAERIREARAYAGIESPSELARRVGVTKSAVSQWENSETLNIKFANLLKVAEVCGVSIEWLVGGKGTKEGLSREVLALAEAIQARPAHQRQALRALLDPPDEHEGNGDTAEGAG